MCARSDGQINASVRLRGRGVRLAPARPVGASGRATSGTYSPSLPRRPLKRLNKRTNARTRAGHSGDSIVGAAVAGLALVPGLAGAGPGPEWAGIFEPSRLRSLGNWGSLGNLATEIG